MSALDKTPHNATQTGDTARIRLFRANEMTW